MFYMKNLWTWERVLRVVVSVAIAGVGYKCFGFGLYGNLTGAASLGFALTGVIGWCPMCAMVGRKLDAKKMVN